ncbi:MAG: hypothetical protein HEP71_09575 [Roseivirga sp.]|nr:hypothetical protein [Roseivirga sp.]
MKLLYLTLLCLLVTTACGKFMGVNSNPFELRYPVIKCASKVQIADPDPVYTIGRYIDPSKGIRLMTPLVRLAPPKFMKAQQDLDYIGKMSGLVEDRIENKFLQDRWIVEVLPLKINELDISEQDKLLDNLIPKVVRPDTVNYENWTAPDQLLKEGLPGYSLFLMIEGHIGINKVTGNSNTLSLFLIDNEKKKITYSDFLVYECDVRNVDGLEKILDHAYRKLLDVRFPDDLNAQN